MRFNKLFITYIFFIIATSLAVILNIPFVRQILGFLFLTFIPGQLIIHIVRLDKLSSTAKIVVSVGLSIAFIMLGGLIFNWLSLLIGFKTPLSETAVLLLFGISSSLLAGLAYLRNNKNTIRISWPRFSDRTKSILLAPLAILILSIAAIRFMNQTHDNIMITVLLLVIVIYLISITIFNKKVPDNVYPISIFLIGLSLLLLYSLRTDYLIGSDVHREFYIFLTTFKNQYWSQLGLGTLDSCISISILPTVYQIYINIDPQFLFKLLPSMIIAFQPLIAYVFFRKYVSTHHAFLISFFLMSQIVFLWTPSYFRINIAIFFFFLYVMVNFQNDIGITPKRLLSVLFLIAVILSHYGVTYVTFFILLVTWGITQLLIHIFPHRSESALVTKQRQNFNRAISLNILMLFLVILFFWFAQVTSSSFSMGVRFIAGTLTNLSWFLGNGSTEQPVAAAFGQTIGATMVPQRIEFVFSWLTIILMSAGLIILFLRTSGVLSNKASAERQSNFLLRNIETEYIAISIACYLALVLMVLIPYISIYYGSARTYFQAICILSIFLIIGGAELARFLKLHPSWVLIPVIVPYFLCTSGAIGAWYDYYRTPVMNPTDTIPNSEHAAAIWLKNRAGQHENIYAWEEDVDVLISQTGFAGYDIPGSRIYSMGPDQIVNGYIFLSRNIIGPQIKADYPILFGSKDKIYSSDSGGIYK